MSFTRILHERILQYLKMWRYFKELAKEKQKESDKKYVRNKGKVSEDFKKKLKTKIKDELMMATIEDYFDESGRQLEKEELIVQAAQTDPEAAKLLEKVDSGDMNVDYSPL